MEAWPASVHPTKMPSWHLMFSRSTLHPSPAFSLSRNLLQSTHTLWKLLWAFQYSPPVFAYKEPQAACFMMSHCCLSVCLEIMSLWLGGGLLNCAIYLGHVLTSWNF